MKIRPESLNQDCQKKMRPVYLLSGAEPLLISEAADVIRQQAQQNGFSERQVFYAEAMNWNDLLNEQKSMSLFASRRIIEIRIANSKPGDKGSKAIVEFCTDLNEDILLLVITGKLDQSQQRSKWVTTLDKCGGHVQVWPVEPRQMPQWLTARLKNKNIPVEKDAIDLLAQRVQGNLLAALQEVEKLSLMLSTVGQQQPITSKQMSEFVSMNARFDVFKMVEHCLQGNAFQALQHFKGLKEEGQEASKLLWVLTKEVSTILQVHEFTAQGQRLDQAIGNAGVWHKSKPLMHRACSRLNQEQSCEILTLCHTTDQSIKGIYQSNPWLVMQQIVGRLCGLKI